MKDQIILELLRTLQKIDPPQAKLGIGVARDARYASASKKGGNNEQIAPVLAVVETAGKRSGVLRGRPTPTFAFGNCLQGDYFEANFKKLPSLKEIPILI